MGLMFFGLGAASCLVLALTADSVLSVAGVLLVSASSTLLLPLASRLENDTVTVADRATALSMGALVADVLSVCLDLVFGWLADLSLPAAMLFGGAVTALGGVIFLISLRGYDSAKRSIS